MSFLSNAMSSFEIVAMLTPCPAQPLHRLSPTHVVWSKLAFLPGAQLSIGEAGSYSFKGAIVSVIFLWKTSPLIVFCGCTASTGFQWGSPSNMSGGHESPMIFKKGCRGAQLKLTPIFVSPQPDLFAASPKDS